MQQGIDLGGRLEGGMCERHLLPQESDGDATRVVRPWHTDEDSSDSDLPSDKRNNKKKQPAASASDLAFTGTRCTRLTRLARELLLEEGRKERGSLEEHHHRRRQVRKGKTNGDGGIGKRAPAEDEEEGSSGITEERSSSSGGMIRKKKKKKGKKRREEEEGDSSDEEELGKGGKKERRKKAASRKRKANDDDDKDKEPEKRTKRKKRAPTPPATPPSSPSSSCSSSASATSESEDGELIAQGAAKPVADRGAAVAPGEGGSSAGRQAARARGDRRRHRRPSRDAPVADIRGRHLAGPDADNGNSAQGDDAVETQRKRSKLEDEVKNGRIEAEKKAPTGATGSAAERRTLGDWMGGFFV